jgi:hypothetical protein
MRRPPRDGNDPPSSGAPVALGGLYLRAPRAARCATAAHGALFRRTHRHLPVVRLAPVSHGSLRARPYNPVILSQGTSP